MTPTSIRLVGLGWRAEYFLRIVRALPELFSIDSVLVRSERSAERARSQWNLRATTALADFVRLGRSGFTIVASGRDEAPTLITQLLAAGHAVLAETPPAPDIGSLIDLYASAGTAPLQVAEQYQYQPQHAARLSVGRRGTIGAVTSAQVSVAHGYHGVSLLRLALGAGFEPAEISAWTHTDSVAATRGRDGWTLDDVRIEPDRTIARLRFEGRTGIYDFNSEQYFSPLRSRHFSLWGSHGELVDDAISYLAAPGEVTHARLRREATGTNGDLNGFHLERISMGDVALYANRFAPARLSDDELAGAEVLQRMADFVSTGRGFYGLADAAQDHYLGILVEDAARTGKVVRTESMPWHHETSFAT